MRLKRSLKFFVCACVCVLLFRVVVRCWSSYDARRPVKKMKLGWEDVDTQSLKHRRRQHQHLFVCLLFITQVQLSRCYSLYCLITAMSQVNGLWPDLTYYLTSRSENPHSVKVKCQGHKVNVSNGQARNCSVGVRVDLSEWPSTTASVRAVKDQNIPMIAMMNELKKPVLLSCLPSGLNIETDD